MEENTHQQLRITINSGGGFETYLLVMTHNALGRILVGIIAGVPKTVGTFLQPIFTNSGILTIIQGTKTTPLIIDKAHPTQLMVTITPLHWSYGENYEAKVINIT